MRRAARLAALVAAAVLMSAGSASAHGLLTGVTDDSAFGQKDPQARALAFQRLEAARGSVVRFMFIWSRVETSRPATDAAQTDPACSCYDWTPVDNSVRDATAAGLQVLLTTHVAPAWWEGPGRPPVNDKHPAGSWRPDPAAYGRFLTAAARRYSGTYPDPAHLGENLPRVRYWQVWNEPNLPDFLGPQWTKLGHNRFREASPDAYRVMLSDAYDALKAVDPTNTVVTAGTAPFGEPWRGGTRMPPALFVRKLLCIDGRAHMHARNCRSTPAKFDVLAHHPYPIGPPGRHAINPDDVVLPDFAKLSDPLKLAIKAGNVFPDTQKQLWATEFSWDSSPPDPGGLPVLRQARWMAGAFYVLWRQGVRVAVWYTMRDGAPGAGYQDTLQAGFYFRGKDLAADTPKPSLRAFRFPFAVYRRYADFQGHGPSKLWGMAPRPGPVQLQTRGKGKKWRTIRTLRAGGDRIFQGRLNAPKGMRLRAMQGGEWSVDWQVF